MKRGRSSLSNADSFVEPLTNGLTNGDMNGTDSDHNGCVAPKSKEVNRWYTRPLHLERKDFISTYQDIGLSPADSPLSQPVGASVGDITEKADSAVSDNTYYSPPDRTSTNAFPVTPENEFARDFFPVTLGAAYTMQSVDPSSCKPSSPPAKGLPRPSAAPWKPHRRTKSPSRKNRPGSAHSSSSSNSRSSLDKMYLMATEAPSIGKFFCDNVILKNNV